MNYKNAKNSESKIKKLIFWIFAEAGKPRSEPGGRTSIGWFVKFEIQGKKCSTRT